MKFIYPAVFRKTDKGTYKGSFPDLEDCFGEGETLDEAIEEANAAAYNWISLELDEDDCQLPPVSDADDLELEEGDIVRNISVNNRIYEGWDEENSFSGFHHIKSTRKEFLTCQHFRRFLPNISKPSTSKLHL